MKDRDLKLQDEMDTDDEDYEVTEGSFVAPRGLKRKRTESEDVGERELEQSSTRKEVSAEATDKPSSELSKVPISGPSDSMEGAATSSTESQESADSQQGRGVIGTLFPFLL
jgi:hypothetical protein